MNTNNHVFTCNHYIALHSTALQRLVHNKLAYVDWYHDEWQGVQLWIIIQFLSFSDIRFHRPWWRSTGTPIRGLHSRPGSNYSPAIQLKTSLKCSSILPCQIFFKTIERYETKCIHLCLRITRRNRLYTFTNYRKRAVVLYGLGRIQHA